MLWDETGIAICERYPNEGTDRLLISFVQGISIASQSRKISRTETRNRRHGAHLQLRWLHKDVTHLSTSQTTPLYLVSPHWWYYVSRTYLNYLDFVPRHHFLW